MLPNNVFLCTIDFSILFRKHSFFAYFLFISIVWNYWKTPLLLWRVAIIFSSFQVVFWMLSNFWEFGTSNKVFRRTETFKVWLSVEEISKILKPYLVKIKLVVLIALYCLTCPTKHFIGMQTSVDLKNLLLIKL